MNQQHQKRTQVQNKCLEEINKHNRCSIAVSMGVGKTYIGLQQMNHLLTNNNKQKFLVVAPKISIIKSWRDEAVKFGLEHLLEHITFTTYRSLEKQGYDFDCIFLDECHNLLYTHDVYLSFFPGKILGLTGTPPRNNSSEKGVMINRYCPVVYSYITDDAIDDNILNDYKIVVHLLELSEYKNFPVKTSKTTFYTSEKEHYNYWTNKIESNFGYKNIERLRISRMQGLMQYSTKERYVEHLLNDIDDKCIIFCNTTNQADKLCPNSYHSKNSNSEVNLEKFKLGEIKCLSTVQQLNEGVNIPNLKYGIILHAYSNERKTNQRLGRLLRLNPDDQSLIHILAYKDTVDHQWVNNALKDLDQSKISYRNVRYKH